MDMVKFVIHLIAFAVIGFATWYDFFVTKVGHEGMGGKFKFLTFWNVCFQTIYFGFNLICDLMEEKSNPVHPAQRGALQRWRDVFHSSIVFPCTMFVCVTFWSLYAIDRELVYPKDLDAIFPNWLNHLVHTSILPFILIDKLVSHHHYPKRLYGSLGCMFATLLYVAWILLIAHLDDFWVYPILEVLGWLHRAVFITFCAAFMVSFYFLGESLTIFIWGKGYVATKSQAKKKSSKKVK